MIRWIEHVWVKLIHHHLLEVLAFRRRSLDLVQTLRGVYLILRNFFAAPRMYISLEEPFVIFEVKNVLYNI